MDGRKIQKKKAREKRQSSQKEASAPAGCFCRFEGGPVLGEDRWKTEGFPGRKDTRGQGGEHCQGPDFEVFGGGPKVGQDSDRQIEGVQRPGHGADRQP